MLFLGAKHKQTAHKSCIEIFNIFGTDTSVVILRKSHNLQYQSCYLQMVQKPGTYFILDASAISQWQPRSKHPTMEWMPCICEPCRRQGEDGWCCMRSSIKCHKNSNKPKWTSDWMVIKWFNIFDFGPATNKRGLHSMRHTNTHGFNANQYLLLFFFCCPCIFVWWNEIIFLDDNIPHIQYPSDNGHSFSTMNWQKKKKKPFN